MHPVEQFLLITIVEARVYAYSLVDNIGQGYCIFIIAHSTESITHFLFQLWVGNFLSTVNG